MMRTLYSGVSGLKVHQTKMDVISNNVANVNTVGYKRATATFYDSLAQLLSGSTASSNTTGKGGTNGTQVGLGVGLASINNVMTTGYSQRTDNANDIMINGDGFFVVGDANNTYFTRSGAFSVDESGNLTDVNGYVLKGWSAVDDPDNPGTQKVVKDKVKDINLYSGENKYCKPQSTTKVEFSGNINGKTNANQNNTMTIYDSLGNRYTLDVKSDYDEATGRWTSKLGNVATVNGDSNNKVVLRFNANGVAGGTGNPANGAQTPPFVAAPGPGGVTGTVIDGSSDFIFTFDANGNITNPNTAVPAPNPPIPPNTATSGVSAFDIINIEVLGKIESSVTAAGVTTHSVSAFQSGTFGQPVELDASKLTQFNSAVNAVATTKDGYTAGSMTGYSIGSDGTVVGNYSNGITKKLYQVPIANFSNPSGLEKIGNNLYSSTLNSGDFDGIGMDATAIGTNFIGGSVEMSNVDLSTEFTDMITTQRGYQANSKSITTADEMIQELLNLKR